MTVGELVGKRKYNCVSLWSIISNENKIRLQTPESVGM